MTNENWGAYPRLMARRQAERIATERRLREAYVDPVAFAEMCGFELLPWQRKHLTDLAAGYDNPAWPDLSERFTPTMAGLPEPKPEHAVWRHPIALASCLAVYAVLLVLGIWWLSGL